MKKILMILLVVTILIPTVPVYARETAVLPGFGVSFNGQAVDSMYRQFPLIVYKDITYVPMTYYDCRYLGLCTEWDNETNTLRIEKGYTTCAYRDYKWQWANGKSHEPQICKFNIVVNGKEIDNSSENYPLLLYRDVTYFPLTWRFAVDEFGWEYRFDLDNGLIITSENTHVEMIDLPGITGDIATDGEFYYYSGVQGDKSVVYRVPVADTSNPQVIHELEESPLTQNASFNVSEGNIYIAYFVGHSAIGGSWRHYKINSDGSVTSEIPNDNYSGGKHGYSELRVEKDGIKVKGVNEYVDGPTAFSYEINGKMYDVEMLPGRVRVDRRRNGITFTETSLAECVKIFDGKIYYTASDLDTGEDSALYRIDTKTGEHIKLLDGVCGFHVYTGWLTKEYADSTMIVYDSDGYLMRYSELNDEIREIENGRGEQGLVLDNAWGDYTIYTVQKTVGGGRTVVKMFNCYASGNCISGTVLDTKTGTVVMKKDDKISIRVLGEAPEDEIRLFVAGKDINNFISSDVTDCVFIHENTLLYKIGKDTVARVELK